MSGHDNSVHWHSVIDIGSNSVRLVIYDVAGRALLPHYNEKVMARLGAGLGETGRLSPEGVKRALKALGRYRAILDGLNVTRIRAVATAAVRKAEDGADFVARVEAETRLKVDVIGGREEAKLSALGVGSGIYNATGIVGDLGGSSLEFAQIENGVFKEGESHMLGPLSMDIAGMTPEKLQASVRRALKKSKLLKGAGGRFYMVGGAWRALATLHMDMVNYPLGQLHAYMLDERAVRSIYDVSQSDSALSRQLLLQASRKRADVMPYAGLILKEIFEIGAFKDVMVSSYGVREGVIMGALENEPDSIDPLLDGAALSVRLQDQRREFGEALCEWVSPAVQPRPDLFGEIDLDMRLVAAACLLADSGARFHPDTRAKLAYDQTLNGPFSNVTHTERAFLALAVGCRYARQFSPSVRSEGLLDKRQIKLARRLGAAMRLGAVYSGRSASVLRQSRLTREKTRICLSVQPEQRAMVSSVVERRLETLASLMDLEPHVHIG